MNQKKIKSQPINYKEKILVWLRDGRKIIGTLRSFDHFDNVVVEGACERIIVDHYFSDIPFGLYVIRGENIMLMGELKTQELPNYMVRVSVQEIKDAKKTEIETLDLKETMRKRMEFLDCLD
ncbi:U6 snRNA-associated Sm-like protein LSm1 [Zostera marina]|uniref:U6 snRNA-associated Sm-like protein LSm1 n=1 Tax=Zostera marina TaxID=29655 RepID=A0A0K9PKW2_ZOSMR|nr:U6 snRNA-associated Sm-like protein LSm1 [Zostera marina]